TEPGDVGSREHDRAARGADDAGDGLEERRLACAVRADDRDDLVQVRPHGDAAEHERAVVTGVQLGHGERGVAHACVPRYASITRSSPRTSSGVPSISTRPSFITTTRSLACITKPRSCSTIRNVMPRVA